MARYENDNVRALTLRDLVIFGIAFMSPTAPALVYNNGFGMSGGAAASAGFFALLFALFTVNSFRKLTVTFPPAGSIYTHADTGARRYVGFITDWSLLLLYVFAPIAFIMLGAGIAHTAIDAIPAPAWVVLFAAAAGLINIFGTRMLALSGLVFAIIGIAIALIYFMVCALGSSHGAGVGTFFSNEPITPNDGGLGKILSSSGAMGVALIGFTAISGMSGEAERPKENIGRAMWVSTLIVGLLLVIQSYAAGLIWPTIRDSFHPLEQNAAIEIAAKTGGSPLVFLFGLATVFSCVAVGSAGIAAASRKLYAMGRKNVLPKRFFTNVNRETRVPTLNVILVFAIIAVLSLLFPDYRVPLELFEFGGGFVFILINLTVLIHFYFQRNGEGLLSCLIVPALGLFGGIYIWISLGTAFLFGILWLIIGMALVAAVDFGIGGAFGKAQESLMRITGKLPSGDRAHRKQEDTEPRRPRYGNRYPADDMDMDGMDMNGMTDGRDPNMSVLDDWAAQRSEPKRRIPPYARRDRDEDRDVFDQFDDQFESRTSDESYGYDESQNSYGAEAPYDYYDSYESRDSYGYDEAPGAYGPDEHYEQQDSYGAGEPYGAGDPYEQYESYEPPGQHEPYGDEGAGYSRENLPPVIEEINIMPEGNDFNTPEPDVFSNFKKREIFTIDDVEGHSEYGFEERAPEEHRPDWEPVRPTEKKERPGPRSHRTEPADVPIQPKYEPAAEDPAEVQRPLPAGGRSRSGAGARNYDAAPVQETEPVPETVAIPEIKPSIPARRSMRSKETPAAEPTEPLDSSSIPGERQPAPAMNDELMADGPAMPASPVIPRRSAANKAVAEKSGAYSAPPVRATRASRHNPAPEPQIPSAAPDSAPSRDEAHTKADNKPGDAPHEEEEPDGFPLQWFVPGGGDELEESAPERPVVQAERSTRPEMAPAATPQRATTSRRAAREAVPEPARGPSPQQRPAHMHSQNADHPKSYNELFVHTAPPVRKDVAGSDLLNQWDVSESDDPEDQDFYDLD